MNIPIITVIILLALLVTADKVITLINLKSIQKNFPKVDSYTAEKNPIVRYLFRNYGLLLGTLMSWVIGLISLLVVYFILTGSFKYYPSSQNYILYFIFMAYGLVLANNTYFMLKYNRVIP